jgi:hypothetical protein
VAKKLFVDNLVVFSSSFRTSESYDDFSVCGSFNSRIWGIIVGGNGKTGELFVSWQHDELFFD